MNLKLFKIGVLFFLFGAISVSQASTHEFSQYSLRARPLGLALGVMGGEAYYHVEDGALKGWFVGPAVHYFNQVNDLRVTSLKTWEIGLRIGKMFGDRAPHAGWFIFGNLNFYKTEVAGFYTNPPQILMASFTQLGEALFAGYQFQASLIGAHWDVRLGLGIAYKPEYNQYFSDSFGNPIPIGVRKRLDPSLEFSLGYLI